MSITKQRLDTKQLVLMALMTALAYVVMYLSKLIPLNVLGFLSFDLKDVMIAISGFLFGPLSAAGIAVVVSLIEMVTVSSTGPIGLLMNVLSSCAFVCPAALIYQKRRTLRGTVTGLVSGVVLVTLVMLLWNYLITPIYMGYPRAAVAELLPVIGLFNVVKAGINATLTVLLYKPLSNTLRRAHLLTPSEAGAEVPSSRKRAFLYLVAFVLLATCVLLALVLAGVI
ncbi:MAG: ECF transporter S component [Oscillospiraceae bacterium]|nr:ECF transporter S component [Oscillospiraceae bacterium]